MKYKILTRNPERWGEGWQYGDVVEMDTDSARAPIENGEIELATAVSFEKSVKPVLVDYSKNGDTYKCVVCGKTHKVDSSVGQKHLIETNGGAAKVETAKFVLYEAKKILDKLGVRFWLDGGTLLGAYRDRAFCKDDEDDIDLCAWIEQKHERIVRAMEEAGFSIHHLWETEFSFRKNGIKIDLFFNAKSGDVAYTYLYQGDNKKPVVIPLHFYENLDKIQFYGKTFLRPKDIEAYLEYKYGDWRTPIHRTDYSCYNNNQNKVIQEDFEV